MTSRLWLSRWLVPAAGLLAVAFLGVLYTLQQPLYVNLMKVLIKLPAPRAFVDWEWIPSAVRCWVQGVDVWVNNTCYRVWPDLQFNYSPLWLRLTFLRTGEQWTNAAVLVMTALFYLSLATLPPARTLRDQLVLLLSAVSSGILLGIERGNADLLMFLLVIAALNLRRFALPLRLLGYALLAFAGMLKFYPFVALVMALRERAAVAVGVALASAAALALLVLAYRPELAIMARNLPVPSYYTLQFGAHDLPAGLGVMAANLLRPEGGDAARLLAAQIMGVTAPLLAVASLTLAVLLGRRLRLPTLLARLPSRTVEFMVVGAMLICGCFFAGQSVLYRGMYLLLALPGFAALATEGPRPGMGLFRGAGLAVVFVLWTPFIEACLFLTGIGLRPPYQGDPFASFPKPILNIVLWLANELAWWGLVTLLLSVVGAFLIQTELWAVVTRRPRPMADANPRGA